MKTEVDVDDILDFAFHPNLRNDKELVEVEKFYVYFAFEFNCVAMLVYLYYRP